MLLDLSTQSIDQIAAQIVASQPPAVLVQAQDPNDEAFRQALKKIGVTKVGLKYVMSPKQQYTLGDNGWPIGRASFPASTTTAIGKVTEYGDLIITPRFTEFGADDPQIGVGIHSFYLTTGKMAVLCTSTPSASNNVKPVCLTNGPEVAQALVSLHAIDFDFNAPQATQQSRLGNAKKALVFSPENNSALLELLKQPNIVLSTGASLDGFVLDLLLPNASSLTLVLGPKVSATTAVIDRLRKAGAKILKRNTDHGGTIVIGQQTSFLGSQRLQQLHLQKSRDVGVMLPSIQFPALRTLAM